MNFSGFLAVGTWFAALVLAGIAANILYALRHRRQRRFAEVSESITEKKVSDGYLNQRRIR